MDRHRGSAPRAGAVRGPAAGRRAPDIVAVADSCAAAMQNMVRLERWLGESGIPVDRALVPLMCLQAQFFTPWLPSRDCYQVARLTTWLMALDNVLDDPAADPGELKARLDGWRLLLEGAGADPADPMERALAEIQADLLRADRPELLRVWRDSMQETLTGMWFEREADAAADQGRLPRLERYLRYGAWTIGVEQQLATLWVLMEDPDLVLRLPVLRAAARQAATAIRLANDLRGHHRERAQGQVDALAIGLSTGQARARFAENVEDCQLELAPLTSIGYGPALALERVLLWHTRMYAQFDPVRPQHGAAEPWRATGGPELVRSETATYTPRERKITEMGIEQEILDTIASPGRYDGEKLDRAFDKLEPVTPDFLMGSWQGGSFENESEDAVLLNQMRWYGKRFLSETKVEPVLCTREDGTVYAMAEFGGASVHDVAFRGQTGAAMVYDALPIIDHFRKVTDDVLIGYMDKKDSTGEFYFHLTRVPDPIKATDDTPATAAVLRSGDAPFRLERISLAQPGPGELRVRISAAGYCHTDLVARAEFMAAALPMVIGHEGAGVVEEVGPGVTGVAVGDHVVLTFDSCGGCANCRAGHPSCCETFVPRNMTGRRLDGSAGATDESGAPVATRWFAQSSMASHAVVTAANTVVVDRSLPLEKLSPLGCGIQTGAGAILRALRVPAGSSVLILGVGTVGLAAVMAARVAGATQIIAVDLNEGRLSLARELGATNTVRGDDPDLAGQLLKVSGGGVQYALDTTGVPAVILAGLSAVRTAGTMGLVALQNGVVELDGLAIGTGKTLTGIVCGDVIPKTFIPQLIELWQQGRFPFDRLLKTYPLSQLNQAEKDLLAGTVIKPVLVPEG